MPPRTAKLDAAPSGGMLCADAGWNEAVNQSTASIRKLADVNFLRLFMTGLPFLLLKYLELQVWTFLRSKYGQAEQ